jgi:flagellar protein FlaJ
MIEELRNNVDLELEMARELSRFLDRRESASLEEKRLLDGLIKSLQARLQLVNSSVFDIVRTVSVAQKLPTKDKPTGLEQVHLLESNQKFAIKSKDKDVFLKELGIADALIRRLKKKGTSEKKQSSEYAAPNAYARWSNKVFFGLSRKLLRNNGFKELRADLQKSNLNILGATYMSMTLFGVMLAVILGVFLTFFFTVFSVSLSAPFFSLTSDVIQRLQYVVWIPLILPLLTFGAFYIYPSTEAKSISRRIESELPFIVIHMGSISGSGIEPTQIFKIVGLSKDYVNTGSEIKKLLNQINIYGSDLVNALKIVAKGTASSRLAELFNGLATTINSGGDLKTYFEKRAETLLLSYRIERENFTKVAETFMDIYISLVIATPMILLLLLVMISVSGVRVGNLGIGGMTFIIIVAVAGINVIFIWLLSLKQPSY